MTKAAKDKFVAVLAEFYSYTLPIASNYLNMVRAV